MAEVTYSYEEGNEKESGPFYAYNCGQALYNLRSQQVNVDQIEPFQVVCIKTHKIWIDTASANGQGGRPRAVKINGEVVARQTPYQIEAVSSRNWLQEQYGASGLVFLKALGNAPEESLQLELLNEVIRPIDLLSLESFDETSEETLARISREGALKLYREMAESALKEVRKRDFSTAHGPKARLYAQAITEMLVAMTSFSRFAHAYLDKEDTLIRKQINGGVGKSEYDNRDRFYQWLLGRRGVDDALTRALDQTGKEMVVKVEQPPIDIAAIVEKATTAAVAAALRATSEKGSKQPA